MNKIIGMLLMLVASLPSLTRAEGLLVYRPPQTGAPVSRVGGGTRGLSLNLSQVQALAPKHTALTGQSQPVLYWYLSEASRQPVEIKLLKEGVDDPLLEKQLPAIATAGLQSIRLVDYGVSLQAGQEYRWSVAIVNDPDQDSGDITTGAALRYQPLAPGLSGVEQKAEAGYWYDTLQELIESHSPRTNDLLRQIDINIPDL